MPVAEYNPLKQLIITREREILNSSELKDLIVGVVEGLYEIIHKDYYEKNTLRKTNNNG